MKIEYNKELMELLTECSREEQVSIFCKGYYKGYPEKIHMSTTNGIETITKVEKVYLNYLISVFGLDNILGYKPFAVEFMLGTPSEYYLVFRRGSVVYS